MNSNTSPDVLNPQAEFLRFPRAGERCPVTNLSRAFLYSLAGAGKIQTVALRSGGRARGVRLIVRKSLIDFIESQMVPAPAAVPKAEAVQS